MPNPILYVAITNHGFGHAVRAASVADQVKKLYPDVLLILVTKAPRILLESYIEGDFIYRPRAFDVGVIQSDSLKMDLTATKARIAEIRTRQKSIIKGEVDFIRLNRVGLMLADIPPLAAPIAKAAGIPVWMMSNFGWDFIYRDWGQEFEDICQWISSCYQHSDRLFRLPFCEPMTDFNNITDVGLTTSQPKYTREQIKTDLGLKTPPNRTVLLTFGGIGLEEIPYHNLAKYPDWQFITFDKAAPNLDNLLIMKDYTYRPLDIMPVCGKIISKPGYSTFAEALSLNIPMISITRSGFAESPLLLEGLQNYGQHQIINPEEFFGGDWEFLWQQPNPPRLSTSLATDGSRAIAQEIVSYFKR